MLLSYKYRLDPNNEQRQTLDRVLDCGAHRQLYNAALQERREAWQKCRISLYYRDQAKQLKELRTFDEDAAWLNYSSIQQTLRHLDKAFQAFFRRVQAGEEPGYPRFKGKGWFKSVCYLYGDGIRLKADRTLHPACWSAAHLSAPRSSRRRQDQDGHPQAGQAWQLVRQPPA